MSKAEEYRKQADEAAAKARAETSLGQGARERRRAEGLRQLADNEDWLDGAGPAAIAQVP